MQIESQDVSFIAQAIAQANRHPDPAEYAEQVVGIWKELTTPKTETEPTEESHG